MQSLATDWPVRSGRVHILQQHIASEEVARAQACILHLFQTVGALEKADSLRELADSPGQPQPWPFTQTRAALSVCYSHSSEAKEPLRDFKVLQKVVFGASSSADAPSPLFPRRPGNSHSFVLASARHGSPSAQLLHYCVCALSDLSRSRFSGELNRDKRALSSAWLASSRTDKLPQSTPHCCFARELDQKVDKWRRGSLVELVAPAELCCAEEQAADFGSEDPGERIWQPVWNVHNATIFPAGDNTRESSRHIPVRQPQNLISTGMGFGIAGALNCISAQAVDERLEPVLIDDVDHPLRLATPPLLRCIALRFRRQAQPIPAAHAVRRILLFSVRAGNFPVLDSAASATQVAA